MRSAKVPQRIRMSLRMRRVAAAAPGAGPEPLRADERVGLRLSGRALELPMGREITAGRSPECELLIDDRLCSRRQAVFSRAADGGALVRDLGSSNGTYVNGIRIYASHRLQRGDWITIGNETLELCILPAAPQGVAPTIPAGPARRAAERAGAKTEPGNPLLSLASLAANTLSRTPPPWTPGAARKPLDALLRRLESGDSVTDRDLEMAGMVALHLGSSTSDPAWLDYLFRLYTARRAPLPAPLLDRLPEALGRVRLDQSTTWTTYIETLQACPPGTWDEAQQRRLTRLEELQPPRGKRG